MRLRMLVGAVAVLGVFTGCSLGSTVSDIDNADSPLARYDWSAAEGGMAALAQGTLVLIDKCVYISWEDDDIEPTLPVFPRDYALWDAQSSTLTYGGISYEVGDAVAAGGGWGPPHDGVTIPESCITDAYGEVMYVQDTSLAPMSERS